MKNNIFSNFHKLIAAISIVVFIYQNSTECNTTDNYIGSVFEERFWYKSHAESWQEASPIGNGRLGAWVYGNPGKEKIHLNEESLWAGCKEEAYPKNLEEHYSKFQQLNLESKFKEALGYGLENLVASPTAFRPYQILGDLFIKFDGSTVENYERSLDLEEGIVSVIYTINGNRYVRQCFVSVEYDVVIYHFKSLDNIATNASVRFERAKDIKQHILNNGILYVEGQVVDDTTAHDKNKGGSGKSGEHLKFSSHIAVKLEDGKLKTGSNELKISNSTEFTVVVSAATDYNLELMNYDRSINSEKRSLDLIKRALKTSFQKIKEEHVISHSKLYNRVDFKICDIKVDTIPTDKRLEMARNGVSDNYLAQLLFQFGRHLLISSSGGKAILPANLQGIWNYSLWPAWESDFHMNINLQMNYWPAEICNLSETVEPLSNFMVNLSQQGHKTAKKMNGSDGWVAHHCANIYGRTSPTGSTEKSQIINGYCFPLAGAWASLSLWRHYEYNKDVKYLEETVYPILKGAAIFILDFLKETKDGFLVTAPSVSPENLYFDPISGVKLKNTVASTIDIQIIKDVFNACIASERILNKSELSPRIQVTLAKLPPLKIGANGTIQEWIEDYEEVEPGHRHISHLYGLYPSNQITSSNAELYKAAEKTIERRIEYGKEHVGWSLAWVINFYARLLDGEKAHKHIDQFINEIYPNFFNRHKKIFQIDGNFGVCAGIAEMLLQSHEKDTIRLLPALPKAWKNGHVKGLKARGNYTVDIYWENGKVLKAEIVANMGGRFKLFVENDIIPVELNKGEIYTYNRENE